MNLFGIQDQYGGYQQPHAANADPETSHEAAAKMEASGKLNRHCEIVLGIIRRQSGTYPELWEAATPAEKAELRRIQEIAKAYEEMYDDEPEDEPA